MTFANFLPLILFLLGFVYLESFGWLLVAAGLVTVVLTLVVRGRRRR